MATVVIQWEGDGLARIRAAIETLGSDRHKKSLARALNHTGDKVYTRVRKLIAERTRAPVRALDTYGAMRKTRAGGAVLEYRVEATGKGIPLKVFKAYQTRAGVSVFAWPKGRYMVRHAFMVGSLGGNVFFRTGALNSKSGRNNAMRKLTGASIPKELVKRYVDVEFNRMVSRELPPRVEHEIRVLTAGVVS